MMMKPAQHGSEKEPVSNKDHCSTLIIMDNSLTAIQPAWKRKQSSTRIFWFHVSLECSFSALSRQGWSCQGKSPINQGLCNPQHNPDSCCRNAALPMALNISVLTLEAGGSKLFSDSDGLCSVNTHLPGSCLPVHFTVPKNLVLDGPELESTVGRCGAPHQLWNLQHSSPWQPQPAFQSQNIKIL